MNNLSQFVDQVVKRQQVEKDDAIQEYRQVLERERHDKEQELMQAHHLKKQQLETEAERAYQVAENSLQLEKRNNKLTSTHQIIETYLNDIESAFSALTPEMTYAFIESILKQHSDSKHAEIIFGELTKAKIKTFETLNVKISEQVIPNKSGFVLTIGDIEYNYLFDSLIQESRRDLQQLILNQMSTDN